MSVNYDDVIYPEHGDDMKITIHAIHNKILVALEERINKVCLHRSITVYITYTYDLVHFDVDVFGIKANVMSIEMGEDFLYLHADKLHEYINKKIRSVYMELEYLIS